MAKTHREGVDRGGFRSSQPVLAYYHREVAGNVGRGIADQLRSFVQAGVVSALTEPEHYWPNFEKIPGARRQQNAADFRNGRNGYDL
jgi:hypothetical protein